MKYEAISKYSSEFSVRSMCNALELTSGGYYNWLKREEVRVEKRNNERLLAIEVRRVFEENKCVYGYRKMWRELSKTMEISEYKVKKIMRETGLYSVVVKKFKPGGKKKG